MCHVSAISCIRCGPGLYMSVDPSRCDERLKVKLRDLHDSHVHWVEWGTGTPKDRDEVNRREVYESDG